MLREGSVSHRSHQAIQQAAKEEMERQSDQRRASDAPSHQTAEEDEEIPLDDDEAKPNEQQQAHEQAQAEPEPAQDQPPAPPLTLQSLERRQSFEGANENATAASLGNISTSELLVKDAFLVLRALCKLSMKPLGAESERDLRSHGMRSKLLSMHLILTILKSHMAVFQDSNIIIHSSSTGEQTAFVQAVKQYICLSLSRNAVSSVNQIFELACEIFWLVMSGMRSKMKVNALQFDFSTVSH